MEVGGLYAETGGTDPSRIAKAPHTNFPNFQIRGNVHASCFDGLSGRECSSENSIQRGRTKLRDRRNIADREIA